VKAHLLINPRRVSSIDCWKVRIGTFLTPRYRSNPSVVLPRIALDNNGTPTVVVAKEIETHYILKLLLTLTMHPVRYLGHLSCRSYHHRYGLHTIDSVRQLENISRWKWSEGLPLAEQRLVTSEIGPCFPSPGQLHLDYRHSHDIASREVDPSAALPR